MKSMPVKKLTLCAVVAAVYAVLTMVLPSFTPLQCRASEVLCILPFFLPFTSWGLFVGCLIVNLLSPYGWADVIFGSLATLLCCFAIAAIGKKFHHSMLSSIFACLMPALFNSVIVGAVITFTSAQEEGAQIAFFAINALQLAASEALVMFVLGLPLMRYLPKNRAFVRLCADFS